MAAWPPFDYSGEWAWTDRLLLVVCVCLLAVLLFCEPASAGGGPEQKRIDVNVDIVVPPPEPNNWPAIIGAAAVLGAAGLGILYRRRP